MSSTVFRDWLCDHPRAVLILMHGLGEYSERYDWVAEEFRRAGYAVLSGDLPGHGESKGRRGHIQRFDDFLDVVDEHCHRAAQKYPGVPVVLFGHSMGGLIAIRYLQTRYLPAAVPKLQAVLLSSPSLQTTVPVSPTLMKVVRTLSRVSPTLLQSTRIQPEDVCRRAEIREVYARDQRILHKVTVRFLDEFFRAMDAAVAAPVCVEVPVLLCQAGADSLVSTEVNARFMERLDAPQKRYTVYPECYHELLNEPERETVLQDMLDWLREVDIPPS
jgi:lysophospholipase